MEKLVDKIFHSYPGAEHDKPKKYQIEVENGDSMYVKQMCFTIILKPSGFLHISCAPPPHYPQAVFPHDQCSGSSHGVQRLYVLSFRSSHAVHFYFSLL